MPPAFRQLTLGDPYLHHPVDRIFSDGTSPALHARFFLSAQYELHPCNAYLSKTLMTNTPKTAHLGLRMPELLAPAGSFEKLVTAIHYGADAVYLGGKEFSLRARAANFDEEGLRQAVDYAHDHGVKVYVTVNIFAHNADLERLDSYLILLRDAGADGLIVSDPGILAIARRLVPDLSLHLSTQANVTNSASARFWAEQGVSRLNLARELGSGGDQGHSGGRPESNWRLLCMVPCVSPIPADAC